MASNPLHLENFLTNILQYDQTVVYDTQADYFKNSSSTWLSEEERKKVVDIDEKKERRELHEQKKTAIRLIFNIYNSRHVVIIYW